MNHGVTGGRVRDLTRSLLFAATIVLSVWWLTSPDAIQRERIRAASLVPVLTESVEFTSTRSQALVEGATAEPLAALATKLLPPKPAELESDIRLQPVGNR